MSNRHELFFDRLPTSASDLCHLLPIMTRDIFGKHPFDRPFTPGLLDSLLPEYFAMSQAFPYLQAAAQKENIFEIIAHNCDVPVELELTSVVGNFLCWDETGGHRVVTEGGSSALPHILDTDQNFHANLFRNDATTILNRPIHPHYGPSTRRYLYALYDGLSSLDPVQRCAHMVAFELHASVMIEALWRGVAKSTSLPPEQLLYFQVHVGGNDPAEKYHGEMTQRLIERVVPIRQYDRFLDQFHEAYRLSFNWCRGLVESPRLCIVSDTADEVWHDGACHCRAVRFQVKAPPVLEAVRCNCSICDMTGFLHLLIPEDRLRILTGAEHLTSYQFDTRIANHTFCRICGVKAFYRPRSNPQGYSVNVRCLDRSTIQTVRISEFDGQHWEEAIESLAPFADSSPEKHTPVYQRDTA